jgi:hypothetical protein
VIEEAWARLKRSAEEQAALGAILSDDQARSVVEKALQDSGIALRHPPGEAIAFLVHEYLAMIERRKKRTEPVR